MGYVELDLTSGEASCVEHPAVKLVKALHEGGGERVLVRARREDIPPEVVELVARRLGYSVEELREEGPLVVARLARVGPAPSEGGG